MIIFTKKEVLPVALIFLVILISVLIYPQLPEKVPSHWNAQGQIDAYSGRNFTVFFFPGIMMFLYILMTCLPLIDPLKENYSKFSLPYFWIKTSLIIFFVLLYLYTLFSSFGNVPNIIYFIIPAMSALFIVIGFFLPQIKRNYFVGIRTPWTLASESVWDKTHEIGGRIFILAGLVSLLGLFFPKYAFLAMIVSIIFCTVLVLFLSYFLFRKERQ